MVINEMSLREINSCFIALEKAIEELKNQIKQLQERVKELEENH